MQTDLQHPIDRREFLRTGTAAAGLTLGLGAFGAPVGRKTKPNVLFIITDQQHYDAIAAGGNPFLRTPALDALVRGGTRFACSYSANPLCSPARSSMFTGRPTSETGVHVNNLGIHSGMATMGDYLADQAGYECLYAGKWHLPQTHTQWIPGFRVLSTGLTGQGNLGDTFTSRACAAYLRNRPRRRPFCMVASFMEPHDICEWLRLNSDHFDKLPYSEISGQLPPVPDNFNFDKREPEVIQSRRLGNEGVHNHWTAEQWRYYVWCYYRHVELVDAEIGRVLRALHDCGYERETLVVFTVDHGEGAAHHQMTRKNFLYDEAVRVPLVFSMPGRIAANRLDNRRVVSGMDILPTVCALAGIKPPSHVRGHNLLPVLEGGSAPGGDSCVAEVQANSGRMVRTQRFKLIRYKDDPVVQLFDMQDDPGETRNLAGEARHSDTVRDLNRLLRQWETTLSPAPGVPSASWWRQV